MRHKINTQKMEEKQIGVRQLGLLEINGEIIERVSEFAYLEGVVSESRGTMRTSWLEYERRRLHYQCSCRKTNSHKVKNIIQDTDVKSLPLYGSKT